MARPPEPLPGTWATGLTTVQNPNTDGLSENTADTSAGVTTSGFLYELSPATRVGLAYRSKIKHKLTGRGDFTVPAGGATAVFGPTFADSRITVYATLPEIISASVFHQIDSKWAVMGDVTQTRWSRIPELRIDFANSLKSDGVETLNWENTWRYAVGLNHYYSDRWTWRTGIAYDQTPVPNAESRTARLPDNNRRWLAFGGSYAGSKNMTVDFGYTHVFITDAPINRTGALQDKLRRHIQKPGRHIERASGMELLVDHTAHRLAETDADGNCACPGAWWTAGSGRRGLIQKIFSPSRSRERNRER